mgnify:FL=1
MTALSIAAAALTLSAIETRAAESHTVTVYKTPWCGCCKVWTEALENAGYTIDARDLEDLDPIKRQARVPEELEACHTATIDGYVLEGHVPLQAIDKLFEERPDVIGISVPGMPAGSLGMGYDEDARYTVYSFTGDAGPAVFHEAGK